MVKLKGIITFTRWSRKKIKNQNNEDQIEKHNIINLDWMIKLKINKTFAKWTRKKTRNQKQKD
jgi:hypothetical protein